MVAAVLRKHMMPLYARMLSLHDRWMGRLLDWMRSLRKT